MKSIRIPIIALGTLTSITTITGAILGSNRASADDVVDTTSITVPVSCTMSGTGQDTHHDEVPNGTSKENIGTTTIKAFCNDSEGFAIYAVGFGGDTLGTTVLKDSNLDSSFNINTDTTFTGTSQWAMKLGVTTGTYTPIISGSSADPEAEAGDTDYSTWAEVPSQYTRVAYRTSGTDVNNDSIASAEGATLTTTYKAYISPTQPSGTYTGQVKYTLVHPADEKPLQPQPSTAGCINYFANASNAEGTMGCQSATDGASKTLLASNFSRTGYGFAGWSDAYDYATNPNAHFYGPNETITAPEGTTVNGLSLYAVWVKSEGSIQDTSKVASVCNRLTTAPTDGTANLTSVSAFTDQRDNETYAIAKLADGKCWMIENLRLDSTAKHNGDGSLAQGYGISTTYGNFSGLADAENTGFDDTYVANSLYYSDIQEGSASIDIGTTNYPVYRMPRYNNINTSSRASYPTSSYGAIYSYGNYYTWHAAIANLAHNSTNNRSTASTSLCPTGWHLPKAGNKSNEANNEFWALVVNGINGGTRPANYNDVAYPYYNSSESGSILKKLKAYPNNLLYSGYFSRSSATNMGASGNYWSSTANNDSKAYGLAISSSFVHPGASYDNKYRGLAVRCVANY